MKKNYIKPSLLSETFVANNIMSGAVTGAELLSAGPENLYVGSNAFTFSDLKFNKLNSIKLSDFRN